MNKPKPSAIFNPKLFVPRSVISDIRSRSQSVWKPQPLWPTKNVSFNTNDKTKRRKLIEALFAPSSSQDLQSLGYELFCCNSDQRCGSPFCNYCRTKMQNRYQERVLEYFKIDAEENIFFLTILDDLSYTPTVEIPKRITQLKTSLREFCKNHMGKTAKVFGAFEIDVKRTQQLAPKAEQLLNNFYNLQDQLDDAFMPHFHGIIVLDGTSRDAFRKKLKKLFPKPYQISLSKLHDGKSKEINLATLARYMTKFRYQYADNILSAKPSYGSRFDDDTLRSYVETIQSTKGKRGVRGLEFSYNL